MRDMMKNSEAVYDCLDVFGFSQRVSGTWKRFGFGARSFDIKLDKKNMDICSERGVRTLLSLGAQSLGLGAARIIRYKYV